MDSDLRAAALRGTAPRPDRGCAGFTISEVVLAMALAAMMCAGIFAVGLKARRFAEHNRMATEARSLAKERLEEMIAVGTLELAKPSCTLTLGTTNMTSLGYTVWRQPSLVWHAANGDVVDASQAEYAEAHVDVTYHSPLSKDPVTDTYVSLIR